MIDLGKGCGVSELQQRSSGEVEQRFRVIVEEARGYISLCCGDGFGDV